MVSMGTLHADIQQKQKEIEQHQGDLFSLYADLGRSVALIEQIASIGFATGTYEALCEQMALYEAAKHEHDQLSLYIQQIEDRSRAIKEIEADIRCLHKPYKQLCAQIGAIAYEAYGSQILADHLLQVLSPFFEDHHKRTRILEERMEKSRGTLLGKLIQVQLEHSRRSLLPILAKAGSTLVELGLDADLPLSRSSHLTDELASLALRKEELKAELELHQSAMAKLQSEELSSPKARLEQRLQAMKAAQKACDKAAMAYGKELYETLPEDINAETIGHKAIQLMDQITLHQSRVRMLQKDILDLQNMIKVQELEAQIELEKQKIALLHSQIETLNRQISQVNSSIETKKAQVLTLLPKQDVRADG